MEERGDSYGWMTGSLMDMRRERSHLHEPSHSRRRVAEPGMISLVDGARSVDRANYRHLAEQRARGKAAAYHHGSSCQAFTTANRPKSGHAPAVKRPQVEVAVAHQRCGRRRWALLLRSRDRQTRDGRTGTPSATVKADRGGGRSPAPTFRAVPPRSSAAYANRAQEISWTARPPLA